MAGVTPGLRDRPRTVSLSQKTGRGYPDVVVMDLAVATITGLLTADSEITLHPEPLGV